MPRFFIDFPCNTGDRIILDGENGRHISRSLRMHPGDSITLCDGKETDYFCKITEILGDTVEVLVQQSSHSISEPTIKVTLIQSLPKADKMDAVIQKAVELGVTRVIPILSTRCVSRPDSSAQKKKVQRWQKIAAEAAKQCGRGIIPTVEPIQNFFDAVDQAAKTGTILFFYEGGGAPLPKIMEWEQKQPISIFIGPEGGFSAEEVSYIKEAGAKIATLGPRILRTETAPIAALSAIMVLSGNMDANAFWEEI